MNNQGLPNLSVLIVGNDNSTKKNMVSLIRGLLYNLDIIKNYETATTHTEARTLFSPGKFDVLVSHQTLQDPTYGGEELSREFRNQDPNITTILLGRDAPWNGDGVDFMMMGEDYIEVLLAHLRDISNKKP